MKNSTIIIQIPPAAARLFPLLLLLGSSLLDTSSMSPARIRPVPAAKTERQKSSAMVGLSNYQLLLIQHHLLQPHLVSRNRFLEEIVAVIWYCRDERW